MPPINMVLHCPACGEQHIDRVTVDWSNPPHRSHRCEHCRTVWRPADVETNGVECIETNGVECIETAGQADTWRAEATAAPAADGETLLTDTALMAAIRQAGFTTAQRRSLTEAGETVLRPELRRFVEVLYGVLRARTSTFQNRVRPWLIETFGEAIANDLPERNQRFLEEALELVQACGLAAEEAHQLVDYVFGRQVGERYQEVGGVMITLSCLCLAHQIDMARAGEDELARIWTKVAQIRAKQAQKPAFAHSANYPDRKPAA